MKKRNFTLIELIAVIVILGIIAVVAIPKYVNMKDDAEQSAAKGVYGACQAACAMNYSANALDPASKTPITDGTTLLAALSSTPEGWSAAGSGISNVEGYTITVDIAETTSVMAEVSLADPVVTP